MAWAKWTSASDHRSVFVVEDDLELSSIMDRILRGIDPDIRLSWATSAEEALAALRAAAIQRPGKPFDLIIADIFLEGERTGLELWQHCRLRYPEVPWIVTSGSDFESFSASLGALADRPPYLHKPFSAADGGRIFRKMLFPDASAGPRGILPQSTGRNRP